MISGISNKWMKRVLSGLLLVAMTFLAPSPISAQDKERKTRFQTKPTYPELAKKMNLSGKVRIEVTIAPDGTVKSSRIIGGHPVLAEAAKDAVNRWKYEAASGETMQVVEFVFNLNG
jgi:TonB family protein